MEEIFERLILSVYPKMPVRIKRCGWLQVRVDAIAKSQLQKTRQALYRLRWEQAELQKKLKELI